LPDETISGPEPLAGITQTRPYMRDDGAIHPTGNASRPRVRADGAIHPTGDASRPPVRADDDVRRGGSVSAHDTLPDETISGGETLAGITKTRPYAGRAPRHGLPEIVRAFKSFSARRINWARRTPGLPVWQRNYYEHIIRDPDSWERIRLYIQNNSSEWENDRENPLLAILPEKQNA
jgi:hypothetical protein